jgi:hypothetical protein
MTVEITILIILTILFLFLFSRKRKELNDFKNQYSGIIDVNGVLALKTEELKKITAEILLQNKEFEKRTETLNADYVGKRSIYESLLAEISKVEENLEDISYGLYKPHYDYATSEEYKQKLGEILFQEKVMINSNKAIYCPRDWAIGDSKVEGRKMVKHNSKLMLRAFNGECDSAVAKVSWNNILTIESRVSKAFDAINKLGQQLSMSIVTGYLDLKLQELRLEFELQEKIHQEKEEQRKIREQMREEEKVQQEMERARKEAELDESRYQKALEKARSEISKTTGADLSLLNEKIRLLEEDLQKAKDQKARAISRAQQTKSGHVYIISNIGSFGENVFKFGMTRRLDPQDRIDELGNASVPFNFDVHGLIYSENAPELENRLHKHLHDKRINLVHLRREFFNVTMDEIEEVVKELKLDIQLTKLAEAKAFRMTQSIKEAKLRDEANKQVEEITPNELEKFPKTLI